ncbi:MAG: TRAP transporter small permease subunit [Rhodocyclaceae bacterium]|nr:TRAP transporter small permease subunit [Rhodocyclaceae bacterium]
MSTENLVHTDHRPDLGEVEHELAHHTTLPRTTFSNAIEGALNALGNLCSWLWVVTVAVIMWSVIARYGFNTGSVMLEEIQWHLAGAAWLIGLSYALVHDDHVRVDIIHERFSNRTRAWIEFLGIVFLLMPFLVITFTELWPYAMSSFEQAERSPAPNGLPARWIMKAILALSVGLLAVAALGRLARTTSRLFGWPEGHGESN